MLHGLSFSPRAILALLAVLLAAGALLWSAGATLMAVVLLRPPRMTDGKAAYLLRRLSPGDLGLAFEETRFPVRDDRTGARLNLAAWWIPHPRAAGRCVVLVHGYSDAKVGAIAWAPTLHALCLNILALDLRAHGESEGKYTTAGYFERHDLAQVIDQLKAQRPADADRIALFGISLGAAVVAAAACLRDDVAAVVMECPYVDYTTAAVRHASELGFPGGRLQRAVVRLAELFSGADFSQVSPLHRIPRIPCPLMIIHACDDLFVAAEDIDALKRAAEARPPQLTTEVWTIEDATHVRGICQDPQQYREKLGRFLLPALDATPPALTQTASTDSAASRSL